MAYNRINLLKKIIDIQTIVLEQTSKHGSTQEWIYSQLIAPTYRISRATFYNYLSVNAKKELNRIETEQNRQMSLFEVKVDNT